RGHYVSCGAHKRGKGRATSPAPLKKRGMKGAPMSAMGQKRTSQHVRAMSALPPKADIRNQPAGGSNSKAVGGDSANGCWPGSRTSGLSMEIKRRPTVQSK